MNLKQAGSGSEADERLTALLTNANAVRAITAAVEGTIGPKGLDTMLVDRFGEVIITNDGVTILEKMDVNHPAAKMLINAAKAQQSEIGDGTTTTTVMAGALMAEGAAQVLKGVPVARIIEGLRQGIGAVLALLDTHSRPVAGVDDPVLRSIARIAGREHDDIAELVIGAAALVGSEKLTDTGFKLSDAVTARAGADNEVFLGVLLDKERMNKEMPKTVQQAAVLLIDDALEPEELEDEALGTESGFKRYIELKEEFRQNIRKIVDLSVGAVFVDRGVHATAEEILSDAGIMVVQRVCAKDMRRIADHCGARMLKRTGLKKDLDDMRSYLGQAQTVCEDEKLEQIRVLGGSGKPMATILVGAATAEIVGERERIAKDAASSVQAAMRGGYVPGGGAVELALSRELDKSRVGVKGMSAYGWECVVSALKRPLSQIVYNAGFNPLEKVEEAIAAQVAAESDSLGIDCDDGQVADMLTLGVIDPAPVKRHAIKAAGEVAIAILRIDTIIKKRDDGTAAKTAAADATIPDF
ncbi:MAG: TCP-1/cpn60 chaperonin family protein [Sporomusaceae bacterium]|nr:TCP-1/cpn60 chaperonin family protein [Sporomusaceae bacterium]